MGSGPAVRATNSGGVALEVSGKVSFDRSGTAKVAAGETSKRVPLAGVARTSLVLATIQGAAGKVAIASVQPGTDAFTIHLTGAATTSVTVAWFVLD